MSRAPAIGEINVGDEIFYRAIPKNAVATVESIKNDAHEPAYICDNGKRVPHAVVLERFPHGEEVRSDGGGQ